MNTHTPGEWTAENGGPYVTATRPDGSRRVICITANTHNQVQFAAEVGSLEDKANAILLAASKAMFEALQDVELRTTQAQIASRIGKQTGKADFLRSELERIGKVARAALARAKGETP